jgi:putative ABC transport system substrate-binding protein
MQRHWRTALTALRLAAAFLGSGALAQSPTKVPRVGFLAMDIQKQQVVIQAFVDRMRTLGYDDGRNVVIVFRSADGNFDRLPVLAQELVALKPDVIVTAAPDAVTAAQKATSTIPIVMAVNDPTSVGYGFVESLANPNRNITGVAFQDPELSVKRMDLLRQFVPGISRVVVIWNNRGSSRNTVRSMEDAARSIGIQPMTIEIVEASELPDAVARAKAWGAQGIVQLASPLITYSRKLMIDAAARHKLPLMCEQRSYVIDGCLATYSASLPKLFAYMADYVDRVLRGAKASDLPIVQPREFEFVINEKTADALGLTIKPGLRLQATEIVQ